MNKKKAGRPKMADDQRKSTRIVIRISPELYGQILEAIENYNSNLVLENNKIKKEKYINSISQFMRRAILDELFILSENRQ